MSIITCPECRGKGHVALHGIALTADDIYEQGPDFLDDYRSGVYDTECEWCDGQGSVDEDEFNDRVEAERTYRMESGVWY